MKKLYYYNNLSAIFIKWGNKKEFLGKKYEKYYTYGLLKVGAR